MTQVTPLWRRWVEAGRVLALDPHAQVLCPVHEDGYLVVTDVPLAGGDEGGVERYLRCPVCGSFNSIRKPRTR